GGFDLAAAEAVAADEARAAIFDRVVALADQSLLTAAPDPSGEPRFQMLETIREYGLERLRSSDDENVTRAAHAAHFAALAEAALPQYDGPALTMWKDRVEIELPNFRAALAWADAHGV